MPITIEDIKQTLIEPLFLIKVPGVSSIKVDNLWEEIANETSDTEIEVIANILQMGLGAKLERNDIKDIQAAHFLYRIYKEIYNILDLDSAKKAIAKIGDLIAKKPSSISDAQASIIETACFKTLELIEQNVPARTLQERYREIIANLSPEELAGTDFEFYCKRFTNKNEASFVFPNDIEFADEVLMVAMAEPCFVPKKIAKDLDLKECPLAHINDRKAWVELVKFNHKHPVTQDEFKMEDVKPYQPLLDAFEHAEALIADKARLEDEGGPPPPDNSQDDEPNSPPPAPRNKDTKRRF